MKVAISRNVNNEMRKENMKLTAKKTAKLLESNQVMAMLTNKTEKIRTYAWATEDKLPTDTTDNGV